jgi:phosphatidate phosphatase APP1
MDWKDTLIRATYRLETAFDKLSHLVRHRLRTRPLMIQPFLGYGNASGMRIRARVLADKGIRPAREEDGLWRNFSNAIKRLESSEYPQAHVQLSVGNTTATVTCDNEGFVNHWLDYDSDDLHNNLSDDLHNSLSYAPVHYKLVKPGRPEPVLAEGAVLMPSRQATFGIISDVDDTVLQTGATSTLSMLKKVLFGNARTRLPFAGVSAFYQALCAEHNPIFYVSSSPWNLYDVLTEFFDLNDIPQGPLMLRDWGIKPSELLPLGHKKHKLESIRAILDTYPDLPFVLIGDSGQADPEIYRDLVHEYPERIRAIYIRDVSARKRDSEIATLQDDVSNIGTPLLLAQSSLEAAKHAAELGLISQDTVTSVQERQQDDAKQPLL